MFYDAKMVFSLAVYQFERVIQRLQERGKNYGDRLLKMCSKILLIWKRFIFVVVVLFVCDRNTSVLWLFTICEDSGYENVMKFIEV